MMLERMTASELNEAMFYAGIEPWGEYREELRHGQKMAQFANYYQRDPDKNPEPYPAIDFMNFIDRPPVEEIPPEEAQARIDREVFGLG